MRAAVKRLAALIRRRLARNTQGKNNFSVQRALSHRVVAIVGQENRFIRTHRGAMSPFEHALAPGALKTPITVEDDHRMRAARKTIDLIFFVHRDRGHFLKGPAVWQFAPAFIHFITKFSAAYRYTHMNLLVPS